jgi:hypothetical protein
MISTTELYIKYQGSLGELAEKLRKIFNIPKTNRTPAVEIQERDSVNHGGLYYYFEILGLTLELESYDTESGLPVERSEWPFYMVITDRNETLGSEGMKFVAGHIKQTLEKAGLEVDIEPQNIA